VREVFVGAFRIDRHEVTSAEFRACVAAGAGIAIVPRSVIRATLGEKEVAAYPLPADISDAKTLLVWRRGHQSKALGAMREELRRTKQ